MVATAVRDDGGNFGCHLLDRVVRTPKLESAHLLEQLALEKQLASLRQKRGKRGKREEGEEMEEEAMHADA